MPTPEAAAAAGAGASSSTTGGSGGGGAATVGASDAMRRRATPGDGGVGVGVGGSYNTISSFIDVNTPNLGVAYAPTASKWNFAWAAYAGFAYHVTHNFTVELAYRYIDLGNAQSGDLVTYNGINLVNNPMEFRDITSHDLRLGVRWNFAAPPPPPDYPPLVTKG